MMRRLHSIFTSINLSPPLEPSLLHVSCPHQVFGMGPDSEPDGEEEGDEEPDQGGDIYI